jgi:hypothetical protein
MAGSAAGTARPGGGLAALAASADMRGLVERCSRLGRVGRRDVRLVASSRKAIGGCTEDCGASHVRPILETGFRVMTELRVAA